MNDISEDEDEDVAAERARSANASCNDVVLAKGITKVRHTVSPENCKFTFYSPLSVCYMRELHPILAIVLAYRYFISDLLPGVP